MAIKWLLLLWHILTSLCSDKHKLLQCLLIMLTHLQNDLFCVVWDVKPKLSQSVDSADSLSVCIQWFQFAVALIFVVSYVTIN